MNSMNNYSPMTHHSLKSVSVRIKRRKAHNPVIIADDDLIGRIRGNILSNVRAVVDYEFEDDVEVSVSRTDAQHFTAIVYVPDATRGVAWGKDGQTFSNIAYLAKFIANKHGHRLFLEMGPNENER